MTEATEHACMYLHILMVIDISPSNLIVVSFHLVIYPAWHSRDVPGLLQPVGVTESDMTEQLNCTDSSYKLNKQGDNIQP